MDKESVWGLSLSCKICDESFTYEVKRGRAPSMCAKESCLKKYRKQMRKPKPRVVRKRICENEDCDTEITQKGKGRTIKRCKECRTKLKKKQNAEYRAKTFRPIIREQGICIDCETPLGTKKGRGKLATRCPVCQLKQRNEIARVSALKNYDPVIRVYTCEKCKQEKEQKGRGKLRKTCPDCMNNKKVKRDAKSELESLLEMKQAKQIEKVEAMIQEAEDEYDDVGHAMWSGILKSMDD
jgi:hypothetical protein